MDALVRMGTLEQLGRMRADASTNSRVDSIASLDEERDLPIPYGRARNSIKAMKARHLPKVAIGKCSRLTRY